MSEASDPTTHAYSGDLQGKSPLTFDLNLIYVARFFGREAFEAQVWLDPESFFSVPDVVVVQEEPFCSPLC
ncbi:hypothetical protein RJT34_02316 [Clitoria ternatea]|uniref:Uncharacterized protein n=1 Tax=Clitoria ternatea TaxID=43366 RepID=A0AAN9KIG9_CLITE